MQPKGIAARAAHWSARHRKTAIFGWLAFVVIAFMIGGSVGTKNIADEDMGNGQSKVADQTIARADFPDADPALDDRHTVLEGDAPRLEAWA